ncbi:response regulator transcription factor [Sabulilitoribacter multivorans]|uniref:Response regulator transcription factor n=1 Tax=Flaviramulus multivorans TaxID=1304750 RepID=A0ABS9ILH7_9FLAO|nr:response regulator transcription factor [Flaviramulus multivorans]MCF7561454.1 response regulator transcription factor [Flaviramulus multivorans]
MKIKVSITDDHEMVLKGIASMLLNTPELEVVGMYKNAQETLENIENDKPDILFLDINLPDINGIDLSNQLLKKFKELKIIALTNFEDISFVKRMLKNGVHGYLLKNTDKLELIKAMKTVLSGELFLQKNIKNKLLIQSTGKITDNGLKPNLTRREHDVLVAISEELTTQEISEKLFISPKTVETHRMNIMSKLGAKNSVGIIKIAIEKQLL